MTTETTTLLAVIGTPLALVAIALALTVTVTTRRARRVLVRQADRLDGVTVHLVHELRAGQVELDRGTARLHKASEATRALDGEIAAWTATLRDVRGSIARLDQRRLTPAVRAMRWAGALGRVALMWRTPGR